MGFFRGHTCGVLVDFVAFCIDDPHIGTVGSDAFDRGVARQRTSGPRAEQSATVVVHVHFAIGIDDPGLSPGDRAGRTAWSGIATVQTIRLNGRAAVVVFVRVVLDASSAT